MKKKSSNFLKKIGFISIIVILWISTYSIVNMILNNDISIISSLSPKDILSSSQDKDYNANETEENDSQEVINTIEIPNSKKLDVPLINQLPELYNGCEITSLTMMLNYIGIDVDKMTLAEEVKKDPTPIIRSGDVITSWGDPQYGFVGSISGNTGVGYAVYPEPLIPLINDYTDDRGVNLTGKSLDTLKQYLASDHPIIVWVTADWTMPSFITWTKNDKTIHATFSEHAVLLTGFDENYFYFNDPLANKKSYVSINTFESVWTAMGSMAVSYN